MASPAWEQCGQDGCGRPRSRFTLFCDEHHREQLIRVGLERRTPPDPCGGLVAQCHRLVRAREAGAASGDEASAGLFDLFVHAGTPGGGTEACWTRGLDALPAEAVAGLLAYAEAHPAPRLFQPLPSSAATLREAERLALAVQSRLLQRLRAWVPPGDPQGAAGEDWYREHRWQVEAFFTDEHLIAGSEQTHPSPSGRYRLVVRRYVTRTGCRDYSRGLAYAGDRLVADVRRNYGTFHFGWAEGHPDGHDYLLCGEDYQGQSVVRMDTGRRADYVPGQAKSGHGFCCTAYHPSPDRKLVVIAGCYWGCPYELVCCRFDDPMSLPWPQVDRVDLTGEPLGWADDSGFAYESSDDVRLADGKPYEDLTAEEQEEFWRRLAEVGGHRKRRWLWTPGAGARLLGERIVPADG